MVAALRDAESAIGHGRAILIGATALMARLDAPLAKTTDLDLVVLCDTDEAETRLLEHTDWSRSAALEHGWHAAGNVRLDVIPAGPRALAQGEIVWTSGRRMSLLGVRHAVDRSELVELADGFHWQVPSVPAIALLKMAAYEDRPAERDRDLGDLAMILEYWPPPDDRRRFDPLAGMNELDYDERGPFLLGAELRAHADARERDLVCSFASRVIDGLDGSHALTRMLESAPSTWNRRPEELIGRMRALLLGLGER